jgi:hypothetical protein
MITGYEQEINDWLEKEHTKDKEKPMTYAEELYAKTIQARKSKEKEEVAFILNSIDQEAEKGKETLWFNPNKFESPNKITETLKLMGFVVGKNTAAQENIGVSWAPGAQFKYNEEGRAN